MRWAEEQGLDLEPEGWERLRAYHRLLENFSASMNLVGSASSDAFFLGHVCDCLPVVKGLRPGAALLDVGSGAGFPGLVIGCTDPDREVVLVESRTKRAAFLTEAKRQLGLQRVSVVAERFPGALDARMKGSLVDLVSRATFPAGRWLRLAGAGRDEKRCVLAMLSRSQFAELGEANILGQYLATRVWEYVLPDRRARVLLQICGGQR